MNGNFTVCCAKEEDLSAWILLVKELRENFPGLDMADYTKTLQKNISGKPPSVPKRRRALSPAFCSFPRG